LVDSTLTPYGVSPHFPFYEPFLTHDQEIPDIVFIIAQKNSCVKQTYQSSFPLFV